MSARAQTNNVPLPPLCKACQNLDLSNTNNRKPAKYKLGTWQDVKRKATADPPCPFCVAIRSFICQSRLSSHYQDGEAEIEWKKAGGFFFSTLGDNLAFVRDSEEEETATSPFGSARAVQEIIDPELIKKWIESCEEHHGEMCAPKFGVPRDPDNSEDGLKVLRVIDVEDQCVVVAPPRTRYLALSYVWGRVANSVRLNKNTEGELGTKGALGKRRKELPKTIRDAMDLVHLIGERYLWVDSLCLIQDDENDMIDGISHMGMIYQCALCTIIAAYGVDANSGLPGVHPGSREVTQEIIEVLPGVKLTATTGVYNAMTGGHRTRGWTLQELVLSHRLLVFTEERIYFRCRTTCWSEDTIYDKFPTAINEILHSGSGISFLPDRTENPLDNFISQLFRYSDRKLTKKSDTIHGLTGIIRFLSVQAKSGVLEGLHTSSFDISLLIWDNFPMVTKYGRNEGFPSWSWAGWRGIRDGYGRFCKSPLDSNNWLRTQTYITWYKRSPGKAGVELVWDLDSQLKYGSPDENTIGYRSESDNPYGRAKDPLLDNLQKRPTDDDAYRLAVIQSEMDRRKYNFLHFFAYTVSVKGFGKIPEDTSWAMVYSILGEGGKTCGGIKLDNPHSTKGSKGPHELVLLSKMDKYDNYFNDTITFERPFYWVMLIAWMGKERVVAERRGIGFLFQDCIQSVLAPGKVWKEIVLV